MRWVVIFIVLLSSCYTKQVAIRKFCSQDSVEITIHDTITIRDTIIIPSDSGALTVYGDTAEDSKLKIWLVPNDSLPIHPIIRYKIKEKIIPYQKDIPYKKTIKAPCNCPEVCPKTRWERMYDARIFVLVAFLIGAGLGLYIKVKR